MYKALALFPMLQLALGQAGLGPNCPIPVSGGNVIEGACVPLDQNGYNWACRDGQGFFVTESPDDPCVTFPNVGANFAAYFDC